ncbi:Stk1 family PASTA domain-containing Ser/Thr kinase [Arthrobacter sp. H14-L1]|uniref:Stk1 family PASTA domain-containing Ser/Thr kinase n=1 Tax=Arthrobacter sp. H14-L1 TaxID=2996697 RepID=UPI00226F6244|nr:Stk1 family PASTA domain-containing Ser/Thr kinase [Arthrobacter sp. H14-L1]MCY0904224.1 Stk1 family PASTA domain-containing Ser/Thr kinase [Arthrobacter sp. H14-L1]
MQELSVDLLVGTTVGQRYLVLSKVARGGMSTVYLATDLRLDRNVALKVLHPHLATDNSFLDRLGREAKAAARLSHPHVVGMFDTGNDGPLAYLVMEYIPGHTLRDVLNERGALPPRLALAYLDAVVEGLGAAHAAGLVHRDVKPENVLIADDGRIKVGDFGLARAVTTTTNTGMLIGTVGYLSPELVDGAKADARSDIYSIGIMLFELLTGHQPFRGELPVRVAMQHLTTPVPAPSTELPGLSEDLDELVRCCTEKDPEARPADGFALLEDLRHIRVTLSDAELDFRAPSGRAADGGTEVAHLATDPIHTQAQQTEVIGNSLRPENSAQQTRMMARAQHTTALPAGIFPAARQAYSGQLSPPEEPVPVLRPSRREAKREARNAENARIKAAEHPLQTLRRGRPRRRALIWLIVVLVLALLGGGAGWFFGIGPGALSAIPNVQDKTVAQAQALLQEQGFGSISKDIHDETVQQGLVVTSDPGPGTQRRRFLPVTLLVSMGPVLYRVPALAGGTLEAAKTALHNAKLALGSVTEEYDEEKADGVVLSQSPAPDTQQRGATQVNLVVSKGPMPIPVPNVVGEDKDAARKALTDLGLVPQLAPDTVFDKEVPAGSVVSQDPAGGTLSRGSAVTLTMSKGPKLVTVPSFIGKQVDKAVQELRQLGFQVKVNNILGGFFGTVRDQNPVNKDVAEGSVISLTVV